MQQPNTQSELASERTAEKIQHLRITREFQYLRSLNRKYEIVGRNEVVIDNLLDDQQRLHIIIPKQYPFVEPLYALSGELQNRRPVSQVIEEWVPKVKIFELVELLAQRINEKQRVKELVDRFVLLKAFHSAKAINLIIVLAITLRVVVGLGSYSGHADYPHYGDFQAHRNWMSITLNRNVRSWYEQYDEQPWWRIDYPPIAAYLSWIWGKVYQSIEPDAMRIQRGYESDGLKIYMRMTALLVDLVCLFPPIYLLANQFQKKLPQIFLLLLLIKPDAILVDHGHFQYNSLILGLILLSFYCVINKNWYLACLLYTLALHSKQMATYYSLAFLSALIGVTYNAYRYSKARVIAQIVKYATIVIVVSIVIWLPWLGSVQSLTTVVTAIFPIHRGLYQLKVPNFWCITDTFVQWERHFSKGTLVFLCFCASTIASIPSMAAMIIKASKKGLVLGFPTIGMSFFMFSYHVHQKSILLPLLLMPFVGEVIGGCFAHQLVLAACCALYHLLKEDGQELGYFGMVTIYALFGMSYSMMKQRLGSGQPQETTLKWHNKIYEKWFIRVLFVLAVVGIHLLAKLTSPPQKLPYLFHLLMAAFSFAFNCYFLLLANSLQLEWIYSELMSREKKAL